MRTRLALGLMISVLLFTPSAALAAGRPTTGPGAESRGDVGQRDGGGAVHAPRGPALNEDTDDDGVANCPDPYGDGDNRHPSGHDRHCEGGRSDPQGRSDSDPDGDANGGLDKPGGGGGADPLDQDGNNGCGNDDDFEDDNNGRCLGRWRQQDGTPPQTGAPSQEQPDHPLRDEAFWEVVSSAFNWQAIQADTQPLVLAEELTEERSRYLSTTGGPQRPATFAAASAAGSRTGGVVPARLATTGTSAAMLALAAFLALLAGLGLFRASRRVEGSRET